MAIEHADFDGMERLALVLGAEIASTFDTPDRVKLGHCKLIEEIFLGEDKVRISLRVGCLSLCSRPQLPMTTTPMRYSQA